MECCHLKCGIWVHGSPPPHSQGWIWTWQMPSTSWHLAAGGRGSAGQGLLLPTLLWVLGVCPIQHMHTLSTGSKCMSQIFPFAQCYGARETRGLFTPLSLYAEQIWGYLFPPPPLHKMTGVEPARWGCPDPSSSQAGLAYFKHRLLVQIPIHPLWDLGHFASGLQAPFSHVYNGVRTLSYQVVWIIEVIYILDLAEFITGSWHLILPLLIYYGSLKSFLRYLCF